MDNNAHYLTCERNSVFRLLMLSAGMMGAFTFVQRGGVFCNAQTANLVLMAVALGQRRWMDGLYLLIPITAYFLGTVISEILPSPVRHFGFLRWDTYLVGFEILVLIVLGFLPMSVPDQVVQVSINFIASMQYNTFRRSEGTPMATTFCTNHIRQAGIGVAKLWRKHDVDAWRTSKKHFVMLAVFCIGAGLMTVTVGFAGEPAIWLAAVPLMIAFIMMAHADLGVEHNELDHKPMGH